MTTKKIVLIVVGVVVVLALLAAVFVGGIVGVVLYQVGNSEAAAQAKDFLRTSDKLTDDIGEVKDFGTIITGNVNVANNNGQATLHLKVIGERQTVNASVDLIYTNGSAWRVSAASYVNSSGQTVDLLNPYDSKILTPVLTA
ncbi:MAG TPA: cytochrome c oxidase assembly factor Coa1 family protein [Pyrinomonadaceae bacterium]|nr:cytochrome c oxidase assembly factor Coa1 family protein [Pyrinomonadaceae bacterium]